MTLVVFQEGKFWIVSGLAELDKSILRIRKEDHASKREGLALSSIVIPNFLLIETEKDVADVLYMHHTKVTKKQAERSKMG